MSRARHTSGGPLGVLVSAAAAVAVRPRLWLTALRQARVMARRRWWRRRPFLPVPGDDYLRFRLATMYGDDVRMDRRDVVEYLEWCRRWPAVSR